MCLDHRNGAVPAPQLTISPTENAAINKVAHKTGKRLGCRGEGPGSAHWGRGARHVTGSGDRVHRLPGYRCFVNMCFEHPSLQV